MDFKEVIAKLVDIGVYDVFLPFILTYTVTFAILEKSKIFVGGASSEQDGRKVNAVVAFVIGLFLVASYNTVKNIQNMITYVVPVLMFILCVFLILGFVFGDGFSDAFKIDGKYSQKFVWTVSSLATLIVVIIMLNVFGWMSGISNWFDSNFTSELVYTVLGFAAFVGVLVMVSGGSNNSKSSEGK